MKVIHSDYSFIDAEGLNKKLNEEKEIDIVSKILKTLDIRSWTMKEETQKVLVEVQMLRTNWIFKEKEHDESKTYYFL